MNKKTRRLLSLLLLFSLLVGILPLTGVLGAAAAENESTVTEEERELPAATEATPTEAEEETPTETESETACPPEEHPPEENDPSEDSNPVPEIPTDEENPDLNPDEEAPVDEEPPEANPQADEIRAGSYGLQIPVILYGTSTFSVSFRYPKDPSQTTYTVWPSRVPLPLSERKDGILFGTTGWKHSRSDLFTNCCRCGFECMGSVPQCRPTKCDCACFGIWSSK